MVNHIDLTNVKIGDGEPVFIIAEISGNHDGDLENALLLVDAAKRSGADAIKLQTYTADTITLNTNKLDFRLDKGSPWQEYKTLWNLYQKAFTPWEWHEALYEKAKNLGLLYFSSSFDNSAVDFNENLGVFAHKIASPEIFDIPLLKKVASTGKLVVISTGLAVLDDIKLAVNTLKEGGASDIVLLKCTTSYPTPFEELNLKTIPDMREKFDLNVGLSDHSPGIVASTLSVGFGVVAIEKHIKLTDDFKTVDSNFSSSEQEFTAMVRAVRQAEKAIGKVSYDLTKSASENINGSRSLYVTKSIKLGEAFNEQNVRSVRPGFGLHPKYYYDIMGRKASKDLELGDALNWESIE